MKSLIKTIRANPSPIIELLKAIRDFDIFWDLSEPISVNGDSTPAVIDIESPNELDAIFRRIHLVLSLYSRHKELQ